MENPWFKLPQDEPYVLEDDEKTLTLHNVTIKNTTTIPSPYIGIPQKAKTLILLLHPGCSKEDSQIHEKKICDDYRKNIEHKTSDFFVLKENHKETDGYKWWGNRLRRLIDRCGRDNVIKNLACVDLFPYYCTEIRNAYKVTMGMKSAQYGHSLVKMAIENDVQIITMSGLTTWRRIVPELLSYKKHIEKANPRYRGTYITPTTIGEENFEKVVKQLKT